MSRLVEYGDIIPPRFVETVPGVKGGKPILLAVDGGLINAEEGPGDGASIAAVEEEVIGTDDVSQSVGVGGGCTVDVDVCCVDDGAENADEGEDHAGSGEGRVTGCCCDVLGGFQFCAGGCCHKRGGP